MDQTITNDKLEIQNYQALQTLALTGGSLRLHHHGGAYLPFA
jgi:hypothetical protein